MVDELESNTIYSKFSLEVRNTAGSDVVHDNRTYKTLANGTYHKITHTYSDQRFRTNVLISIYSVQILNSSRYYRSKDLLQIQ